MSLQGAHYEAGYGGKSYGYMMEMALWRNRRFERSLRQQTRGKVKLKLGDGVLHDLTLYRMLRLFHYTPVCIF